MAAARGATRRFQFDLVTCAARILEVATSYRQLYFTYRQTRLGVDHLPSFTITHSLTVKETYL